VTTERCDYGTLLASELRRITLDGYRVTSAAISADNKYVVLGGSDGAAHILEISSGHEAKTLIGHSNRISSAIYSSNDRSILTASDDQTARLWDSATGREVVAYRGFCYGVQSAEFSADSRFILVYSFDRTGHLWDTRTGSEVNQLHVRSGPVHSATLSSDGKYVLTTYNDRFARLCDTATGAEVHRFTGHSGVVNSAVFTPDRGRVLTASDDRTARLWDVGSGRELSRLEGHSDNVNTAVCSDDSRFVLTASSDKTARLWDTSSGRELCRLMSFGDGTWAVTDPDGRYDASTGGDIDGLYWIVENESVALKQFKADYYEPGLLAKIMGFNKEPLRKVKSLSKLEIRLPPNAAIVRTDNRATVTLADRGGGIGPTQVFLNDALILTDPGPRKGDKTDQSFKADKNARTHTFTIDLSRPELSGKLLPGGEAANQLRVVGHTFDKAARPDRPDYLASRAAYVGVTAPAAAPVVPPRIFILAAGASCYAGPKLELRFAAKDAIDFERAARAAAEGWLGSERVFSTLLASDAEHPELKPASRANVLAALDAIARSARSTDIILLYLSGHGVATGSGDRDYYYITSDADDATPGTALFPTVTISGRLLSEKLAKIDAAKRAVILDTCASGEFGMREGGAGQRRPLQEMSDIRRSWEDMKDRTGAYILAGCAADAVSYESGRYNQGLLTYCLLEAMKANDAVWVSDSKSGGPYLDVQKWLEAAERAVPRLMEEAMISGIQRPEFKSEKEARDFYAGRLTKEARQTIKLATPLPILLPVQTVIVEGSPALLDTLGLRAKLNDVLLAKSARGRGQGYALWRTDAQPGAYLFTVRYRAGPQIAATVNLLRYPKDPNGQAGLAAPAFTVTAPAASLPDAIVAAVVRQLEVAESAKGK